MPTPPDKTEESYLKLLLDPLDKCANYKPKFGSVDSKGVSLSEFKDLYGNDPFYHWVGLDDELMYAAHKAAGGMTSVYRQLGQGCERLFRAIVKDSLGLNEEQVSWKYVIEKKDGKKAVLTLDARIDLDHIKNRPVERENVQDWLVRCANFLDYPDVKIRELRGVVFEARQGYKSADAKRQNADLQFAVNAVSHDYLPVLSVISTHVSQTVIRRYRNAKMLVITGNASTDDTVSTYAFFRKAVGFELDQFFERNTENMRKRCRAVLEKLLTPA